MSVSTLPTNSDVLARITNSINTNTTYGNEYSINRTSLLNVLFTSSITTFLLNQPVTFTNTTSKTSGFIRVAWTYDTPVGIAYPYNITFSVAVNGVLQIIPAVGTQTGLCPVPTAGVGRTVMVSIPCTLLPNASNTVLMAHAFPSAVAGYQVAINSFNFEVSALTY